MMFKHRLPGLHQATHLVRIISINLCYTQPYQQVAQWATIAHHGASIMFGDTIIYDAQRQITLNLKQ